MARPFNRSAALSLCALTTVCLLSDCESSRPIDAVPVVEVTAVPPAADGDPDTLDLVEGRAVHSKPNQRIVLYAEAAGIWWVQPSTTKPFTKIEPNSTWHNATHLGGKYAALLVDSSFVPPLKTPALPEKGGAVLAVAIAQGKKYPLKIVQFSGYDWEVRQVPSARGGKTNPYDASNVWTDANGFLHLRVVRRAARWSCAEVSLTSSLGQGSYWFTVHDVSQLDPAAALTLYTWGPKDRFHREIDVEVSRWGNSTDKNAQYVVQPYYEPVNVFRFESPPGALTFSFSWESGKVSFRTMHGRAIISRSASIAEHTFTSGVPSPGDESVHMNLYAFGNTRVPMRSGAEVIIEKFEYLP